MRERFKQSHANVLVSDLRNWVCKDAMLKARFWNDLNLNATLTDSSWLLLLFEIVYQTMIKHRTFDRIDIDWGKDGIEWKQSTHDGHQIIDSNVY